MKLFFRVFGAIALDTCTCLAAAAQSPSPAEKLAKFSPEQRLVAGQSTHFSVYVTRPDGSLIKSNDSDTAFILSFVEQAHTACQAYVLDSIGSGSLKTGADAAKAMLSCMDTNVQKNKVKIVVRLLEPTKAS